MYLISQLVNGKNVKQSERRKYYLYIFHWSTSSPSPFDAATCILRRHIHQLVKAHISVGQQVVSYLVNQSVIGQLNLINQLSQSVFLQGSKTISHMEL